MKDQARRDFLAYCQKCAELVATWPAWKRDCLSRPATEEIAEEFDTADPCVIVDCRGPSPAD